MLQVVLRLLVQWRGCRIRSTKAGAQRVRALVSGRLPELSIGVLCVGLRLSVCLRERAKVSYHSRFAGESASGAPTFPYCRRFTGLCLSDVVANCLGKAVGKCTLREV